MAAGTVRAALCAAMLSFGTGNGSGQASMPPQVILNVLFDDLGWANVGWQSPNLPESATPRLTALATAGVILKRRYAHYTCTPSRSSLATGRLPVHVQLTLDNPDVQNAGVPANMTTLPAKLFLSNFTSHLVGKHDMGFARPVHTPEGRGYASSLIYASHMNNYFTYKEEPTGVSCANLSIVDLWDSGAPARALAGGGAYIEDLFVSRALAIIAAHNFSRGGLFLDYRPHSMHWPLMVPEAAFANFSWVGDDEPACRQRFYGDAPWPGAPNASFACRRLYQSMLALADAKVGALVDALTARGLWEQTLVLFHGDNGGSDTLSENSANNWPLRGGKYSPFEGGVRVPAFVGGGFVPAAVRGTQSEALISTADYLLTLCLLAGGASEAACRGDALAEAGGLPPQDSQDFWPAIVAAASGTTPVVRTELPIDAHTLLSIESPGTPGSPWWKLHTGMVRGAGWHAPVFPNSTSPDPSLPTLNCSRGCLFDVSSDEAEAVDVASLHPDVVARLTRRLANLSASFYSNADIGVDACPQHEANCACWMAHNTYGGFFGPWQK